MLEYGTKKRALRRYGKISNHRTGFKVDTIAAWLYTESEREPPYALFNCSFPQDPRYTGVVTRPHQNINEFSIPLFSGHAISRQCSCCPSGGGGVGANGARG